MKKLRDMIRLVVLLGLLLSLAAPVSAQEDEEPPVRIAVVNTTGSAGQPVAATLTEILEQTARIELFDAEVFTGEGASFGVTLETLRKGSLRDRHAGDFAKMLERAQLDGVLILDIFSGKAQVVTIGPAGEELHDARRSLSRGDLPYERAKNMLRDSFRSFIPVWRAHREKMREEKASPAVATVEETEAGGPEAKGGADTPSYGGQVGPTPQTGELEPGVSIWVGGVAGRHRLTASSEAGYALDQMVPLAGLSVHMEAVLTRFEDKQSGLGFEAFGAYAPFKVALTESNAERMLAGQLTQAGLDLKYLNQVSEPLRLELGVGFEVLSLMVASNPLYTGNRYAQVRLTGGLDYQPAERITLGLQAGAAPVVSADMSGGAFAQQTFTAAWLAGAHFGLETFGGVRAQLGYQLYYYGLMFRQSTLTGGQTQVEDVYHLLDLSLSYGF